jgi:hypothetical protein
MPSTRSWSFTTLLAAIVGTWFLAIGAWIVSADAPFLHVVSLGLALLPPFLAGSWAGAHPEIRDWSRIRLGALWLLAVVAVLAIDEQRGEWKLAVIVVAPVAILTIRWLEVRRSAPSHTPD